MITRRGVLLAGGIGLLVAHRQSRGPAELSDQRIGAGETAEPAEIAIGGLQLSDAVESAQPGHARVVDLWTGDAAIVENGFQFGPITVGLYFLASSSKECGISTVVFILLYVSCTPYGHQLYGTPVAAAGSAALSWMRQAKLERPIDLGTAKTAGIAIPQRLLLRAGEVIQ